MSPSNARAPRDRADRADRLLGDKRRPCHHHPSEHHQRPDQEDEHSADGKHVDDERGDHESRPKQRAAPQRARYVSSLAIAVEGGQRRHAERNKEAASEHVT